MWDTLNEKAEAYDKANENHWRAEMYAQVDYAETMKPFEDALAAAKAAYEEAQKPFIDKYRKAVQAIEDVYREAYRAALVPYNRLVHQTADIARLKSHEDADTIFEEKRARALADHPNDINGQVTALTPIYGERDKTKKDADALYEETRRQAAEVAEATIDAASVTRDEEIAAVTALFRFDTAVSD